MITRLRHVNPVQFALVIGIVYAIIGLIVAILWLPLAGIMAAASSSMGQHMFGAGLGVLALVVFPVMYFIIAFIGGLIVAAVYNLIAGWTGGIEMTLEQSAAVSVPGTAPL